MSPIHILPTSPTRPTRRLVGLVASVLAFAACGSDVTDPGGDPNPPGGDPVAYDHGRSAGASAFDLLSSEEFDRLVVQVQYVEGFRPTDAGLEMLEAFVQGRVHKPAGVEILVGEPLQIASQTTYSASDVRTIEAAHRTEYTQGATLAIYLLFLDGSYVEENVLGIAYNNTSMAVFEEKITQHSGGTLQPSRAMVEGTVAMHEVGHLLGLVNNGSAMVNDHQDEPNGRHCDDENCLMYYAVRTTDFLSNLLESGTPELDSDCIDDLRANGGP